MFYNILLSETLLGELQNGNQEFEQICEVECMLFYSTKYALHDALYIGPS
jgi:hypothetical protein